MSLDGSAATRDDKGEIVRSTCIGNDGVSPLVARRKEERRREEKNADTYRHRKLDV